MEKPNESVSDEDKKIDGTDGAIAENNIESKNRNYAERKEKDGRPNS